MSGTEPSAAPESRPPTTSIRRRLAWGSVALIVAAFVVCAAGIYFAIYRPLLANLALLEMRSASEKVASDVGAIFRRVIAIAERSRGWGELGVIDLDDLWGLNRLLGPVLKGPVGIASVAIAQDSGREALLLSSGDGWRNRLTNPDLWGREATFTTWNADGELIASERREVDYDARRRPWFIAAMAQTSDALYWTPPYKFVSTQELGISAVVRWTARDGRRFAMTTDLRLLDLTRFTQQIQVARSGLAAILTEDGKVVAVPRDPRFETADAVKPVLLDPVDALAVPPLAAAYREWQARGRPAVDILGFEAAAAPWLATFTPIRLGAETLWIATVAPAADFGRLTAGTLALGALLVLGSIAFALLGALWLGRRFSGPIEQLTRESARIGRMELEAPIDVRSPLREIDVLARSLETMRVSLARARSEIEAKAGLERQLEQARRTEAIGRLAGGIAHDFNNILGSILGFAGFLVADLPKDTPQHGFAERIRLAGRRGREMVEQILAFSRSTTVERTPQDLARIVSDTQAILRASVPATTRLELAIEDGGAPLIAQVNVGQISQVLLNLCLNAHDALSGEPGSVAIALGRVRPGDADYALFGAEAAGARAGWIAGGTLVADRSYARLTVADSGSGIDPATLARIFDPFFTTKKRGTGLGLSVVHGIVLAYEGAYTVATRLRAGTTFKIYLPLLEPRAAAERAAPPVGDLAGHERLLVVDDDRDLTDMLAIGLERLGYAVVGINDPAEALAAVAEDPHAFDVVISDDVMPGMRGVALCVRLKAIRPALRFILCTGFSDARTEEMAAEAHVDAVFVKPVAPEQLAATIRRLLLSADADAAAGR